MTDNEQWVIWNGSLGVLDMVSIGHVEETPAGRLASLAPPYDVVGPFSLDQLEAEGRIAFGACLVMSRRRWQEDQVELRQAGMKARRALMMAPDEDDGQLHRAALDLPAEGALEPAQINAAFRRMAKSAHPDAGGSAADYRRISEARDALMDLFAAVS
ncbi:J domain-containing protein [Xanthobacter sp. V3C-3]|uniref:J domain-containing protein n=1 Tax=Xanthobacter lutulentifluminis TaxID=3119935 RepID=UPI0037291158